MSLRLNCQTVMSLIQWAYVNFADDRFDPLASIPITGGPAWIDSDLFEINAKAEAPRSWGTRNGLMLRTLLEDRFKLKIHRETRGAPVYALTVAKGGPRLQPSRPGSCIPFDAAHPPPQIEPGKPFPRLCGISRLTNGGWDAPGVTMAVLCRLLSDNLDRTAVDKTGIAGTFDVHLDLPAASASEPGDVANDVRKAVQKLGLRLDPARGTNDFLVIDRVDKPSGN